MNEAEQDRRWNEWLAARPESIRRLAAEFPPGSTFLIDGRQLFLIGYREDDMLIVSPVDPAVDAARAEDQREYLCASHYRQGTQEACQ